MRLPYKKKEQALVSLIERENVKNAFIFLNRKKDIGGLAQALSRRGLKASPMHGDMPQAKRNEVLQAFKNDEVTLLICSDVAARGLDIKGVSHVFNFDIPMHPDDYVHRIGRTGRAGMSGRAFTFVSGEDDEKRLANIERLIKKSIDVENLDVADDKQDRPAPKREKQPRSSEASEKKVGGERRARASARDDETGGRFGVDDDIPDFLRR
jgi:superfamily II DNA/RNA helicase